MLKEKMSVGCAGNLSVPVLFLRGLSITMVNCVCREILFRLDTVSSKVTTLDKLYVYHDCSERFEI